MNPDTLPDLTLEVRRQRLADVHRQVAAYDPVDAGQAILQQRLLDAADELEERLDNGGGHALAGELLWSLVHLAPDLLEGGDTREPLPETTDVELIEARDVAGRLRTVLAGPGTSGPLAKRCRLLALMCETVEHLASFELLDGDMVAEGVEVLRAGTAILESVVEGEL